PGIERRTLLEAERQRICACLGRYGEATAIALDRAEASADPVLRGALWLLALEYARRDGAPARSIARLTWRVLDEMPVEVTTAAFLQHLFEVLEGAYIESGQFGSLVELWRST